MLAILSIQYAGLEGRALPSKPENLDTIKTKLFSKGRNNNFYILVITSIDWSVGAAKKT